MIKDSVLTTFFATVQPITGSEANLQCALAQA